MGTNKNKQRHTTKRRKELRKGLLAFLKRLRKACKSYASLADWNDLIQPLENLIDEYAPDMPPGSAQRLQDAMRLKAATAQGIQAGCQILQREVEGVIGLLPAAAVLGTALIAAFIVVALGAAASAVVLSATARQVVISNQRCGDIRLPSLGFSIPGLYIPPEIQNDRSATATIPGFLKVDAEVRQPEKTMAVWIFNTPLRFSFDSQIQSLTFDGVELINRRTTLDLGTRPSHELIFACP